MKTPEIKEQVASKSKEELIKRNTPPKYPAAKQDLHPPFKKSKNKVKAAKPDPKQWPTPESEDEKGYRP